MPFTKPCGPCDGRGYYHHARKDTCQVCRGEGVLLLSGVPKDYAKCSPCDGRGYYYYSRKKTCVACKGTGMRRKVPVPTVNVTVGGTDVSKSVEQVASLAADEKSESREGNDSTMRLTGKSALVTGAASGIGKAVVSAFLREGAEVIGADIAYPEAASRAEGDIRTVHLDVSKESDWERLTESITHLDVLVACAGISDVKPIPETSLVDWRRVTAVNLDGAFLSVKYGVEAMRGSKGGAIVLVGSASGIKAVPGSAAYCASKAAARMLVKAAALEFKSESIRVNCVSPAGVVTPMWQKMPFWRGLVEKHGSEDGAWEALGGVDPATPSIQRMAFPEEVAAAIVFLTCDDSAHITGADLVVDGGYSV